MQLSMLMLLASIFFSGFFLPLENFASAMRVFTSILPLTHGILGLQAIMLKGTGPSITNWVMLTAVAVAAFLAVQLIFRRQLKRLHL